MISANSYSDASTLNAILKLTSPRQCKDLPTNKKIFDLSQYDTNLLHIRRFEPQDEQRCKNLFKAGICELYIPNFINAIKSRTSTALSIATLLILIFSKAHWFLYFLVPIAQILPGIAYTTHNFQSYINCSLKSDLSKIEEFYINKENNEFWVAVLKKDVTIQNGDQISAILEGTIVGMVALEYKEDKNESELRRMSVDLRIRRAKIASVLCKVLEEFARNCGSKRVVLTTSGSQVPAIKMYEKNGYKIDQIEKNHFGFELIHMSLDLQKSK